MLDSPQLSDGGPFMRRRDFLRMAPALPALAEVPRLRGAKIRITDVRLLRTRVVRDPGTPEERARQAAKLKGEGWQAIKYRTHFPTFKEDLRLVEQTRKAVGDDWK